MIRLREAGDTIVEVLICVALVGSALAGSYAIASRNLNATHGSQEHAEALKNVQTQIERLKAAVANNSTPTANIYQTTHAFCFDSTAANTQHQFLPGALTSPNLTGYQPACISGFYHVSILYSGSTDYKFTIQTRWFAAGGGINQVTNFYRLPP